MHESSIQGLYDALRASDRDALERLLPPLRVRLERLAQKRLGGADAEEVVQETLATLWERRGQVAEPAHLLPFVFKVLRFKVGGAYRRMAREHGRRSRRGVRGAPPANPLALHPEALIAGAETREIVSRAIRRCASENAALGRVLELLRDGRSAAEIQEELGELSMGAVRTRICRARKRLKEILREEFHFHL
jgi:DNA-directed RNA polymerase specialized sigma24 family protein